jgi:hypothetical protein
MKIYVSFIQFRMQSFAEIYFYFTIAAHISAYFHSINVIVRMIKEKLFKCIKWQITSISRLLY